MTDEIPLSPIEMLEAHRRTRQQLQEYCDKYGIPRIDDGEDEPVNADERVLRLVRRFDIGIGYKPDEMEAFEKLSELLDAHGIPTHGGEMPFLVRVLTLVRLLQAQASDRD